VGAHRRYDGVEMIGPQARGIASSNTGRGHN
jgi:hypothetical protein